MRRLVLASAAVSGLLAFADVASAQMPASVGQAPQAQRPVLSPYLNLLRGGSPALNYYNLVRPQEYYNSSINRLQQQQSRDQQTISALTDVSQLETGHPVQFMNYSRYFLNVGAQRTGVRSQSTSISETPVSRQLKQALIQSRMGPTYPTRPGINQ